MHRYLWGSVVLVVGVLALGLPGTASASSGTSTCLARHLPYIDGVFEPSYTAGCVGHDEPELDPLSTLPGSARDMTWSAVLPTDGLFPVAATGPTFWFGGTVTDPNSLFGQAFLELQFYPDSIVSRCGPGGGANLHFSPNTYTACSPVWSVVGNKEPAAFNAMLTRAGTTAPLVMHAGDVITVHYFATAANDGAHITVKDVTSGENGTIILNSPANGPLMPAFSVQRIGNALGWGIVHDAPNSFVWEIGHRSVYSHNPVAYCQPGQTGCQSYNAPAWMGTSPIRILSVSFGNRGPAKHWAVVSDYGGKAEVTDPGLSKCAGYGGPFCIYPWYSENTDGSFSYGVDFPSTAQNFGRAAQFAQTTACGGPFGADTTYCMTRIK